MATFIPNIGDVTPEVEYFRPNLELMAGYLETRQGQFNAARDELNTMYNTLMSLDLTLDENKKRREEYFKAADQQIKKFANVDISLPENIAAAKRVFTPLVEDEAMSDDFLFTSKIKNIITTAEKFRNSSEEEDRARYNPESIKYAQLKQQEYINASPEARKGVSNSTIRYVSNVNLMEKATALAKEMDLNVTIDSITGGYKVTNKNGQLITPQLQQAFTDAFMSDPEVVEYYEQRAYVDVQSQIQSLAPQLGYQGAIDALSQTLQASSQLLFAKNAEEAKKAKEVLDAQRRIIENKIETEGIVEGSEAHREYLNVLKNLETASNNQEIAAQGLGLSLNQLNSTEDLYSLAFRLSLSEDIQRAAQILSDRGMEQTVKEDAFALEAVRQQNRLELALFKAELDNAGSSSSGQTGVSWDPVQAAVDAGARSRGAEGTEYAGNLDITTAKSALKGYVDIEEDMYRKFITNFLSKENGGYLSSVGGGSANGKAAVDAYLTELDGLGPLERQKRIADDLLEISQSGHSYDAKALEDMEAMVNSIAAANNAVNGTVYQSHKLLQQEYAGQPDELMLSELMFDDAGVILSESQFVNQATDFVNANIARQDGGRGFDQNKYTSYRQAFDNYGSAYPTYAQADPNKLKELYQVYKNNIDNIYKNNSVNVHQYFDPDIVGGGSSRAFEVNASYVADPMTYYNKKKAGHQNSKKAFTVIAGTVMAAKNSDSYIYPGSMIENNYFGLDAFPDGEDNKMVIENTATELLNSFLQTAQKSNDGSSVGRPTAIVDVAKGITIGDKRYVATQITFDENYMAGLKEDNPGKYKDAPSKYTIFTPQEAMPVGYFPSDGSGALMASIIASGERTTQFPQGLGSVTYTYDDESGLIQVYGKIKSLNPENGGYEMREYVESVDEENFDIVRNSVWNVVQATLESNEQRLKELEAAQGITRVTDPNKLK